MEKVVLLSNRVWIAENASNGNMQARFVICDFSTNKNGVRLNRDTIENWMQSMVNQPLVGKIKKSALDGVADFTGHNMKKSLIRNSDGDYETVVEFDTDAFGTFVSVDIEEVDGVDCIVGTAEIWSRYPRVVNLIRDRIESGTLQSSWEITVNASRCENNEKIIDDGIFTALCCLGKRVEPAYDSSRLLEVAEAEMDDELTSAIVEDLKENAMNKEEKGMIAAEELQVQADADKIAPEQADGEAESVPAASAEQAPADDGDAEPKDTTETSALTSGDLYCRIAKACRDKLDCEYGYIAYWFPANNVVWYWATTAETELDYVFFVYSVMDDDTVSVDDGIPVKLTVSVVEMQAEMTKKDAAIAEAVSEIAELKDSLQKLESFKDAYEKAERERLEAEKNEQRDKLKAYALRSGLISEKDCESKEIAEMIASVDEAGIKQLIANRYMESREKVQGKKPEGVVTASLTTEDARPIKVNAVQAYLAR